MSKLSVSVVCGAVWILSSMDAATVRAEAVPEVAPMKVIDLATPNSKEVSPVVSGVALDSSGKILAAVGDDHLVRILDLEKGEVLSRRKSHTDWGKAAVFRPDGKLLVTTGDDRRVRLWDPLGQTGAQDLAEQPQPIYRLAYSADGQMLATAGFDDKIRLYEMAKGSLFCDQPAPGVDIRALCFSPDGTLLAAAGRIGLVRVWNTSDCSQRFNVKASPRRICAMAYSPDSKILAVAGQERTIRLLDASTGKTVADLPERPGEVLSLCFCGPDLLASSGSRNVIYLWNINTRQESCRFVGHTGSVTTLAYHTEANTLISGSYDTTVRLWNVKDISQEKVTRR